MHGVATMLYFSHYSVFSFLFPRLQSCLSTWEYVLGWITSKVAVRIWIVFGH